MCVVFCIPVCQNSLSLLQWRVFVRHLQLPPPQPHLRVSPLTTTSSSSFSASSSSTSSSAAASASSSVSPSRSHLPKQKWAKQCSSLSRSSPNVNLFLERQQQPSQQLQLQLQQPVRRLLGSRAAQLQRQRKGSFGEELFYGRIVTIDHPFLNAVDDVAYSGNSINAYVNQIFVDSLLADFCIIVRGMPRLILISNSCLNPLQSVPILVNRNVE